MKKLIFFLLFLFCASSAFATQPHEYHYYVGPWVWHTADEITPEDQWEAPAGTVGLIDLRNLSAQGQKTIPSGYGFFAVDGTLPAPYVEIAYGYIDSATVSNAMKNQIKNYIGYKPVASILRDVIWEILTTGSDPTGQTGVKPLMPTFNGTLELSLGGHSVIKSEPFIYGISDHTQKVKEVLQNDYRKARVQFFDNKEYLKILDYWGEKYHVKNPEDEFIPADLPKEKPLKHGTTLSESWTAADSTNINADLTWNEYDTGMAIVSNKCRASSLARAIVTTSTLSGVDHYSQSVINHRANTPNVSNQAGTLVRHDGTTTSGSETAYYGAYNDGSVPNNKWDLYKIITGTFTSLGNTTAGSSTHTIKTEANGSAIKVYENGSSKVSVTDTAITAGQYVGIAMTAQGGFFPHADFDDFLAADLGGGGGGSTVTELVSNSF